MDAIHYRSPSPTPSTDDLTDQCRDTLTALGVDVSGLTDRKLRLVLYDAHRRLTKKGMDTQSSRNWLWVLTPDRPIH